MYPDQARENLFKACPEWKAQQKSARAEARKETGRRKDRRKIRDLLADERCGRAGLDFLTSRDVGRWVLATEEDTVSEVSEAELREWELGVGAEELGTGEGPLLFLPTSDFLASAGEE